MIQNASCSNPLGSSVDEVAFQVRPFSHRSGHGIGNAFGEKRFAVDLLGRFLRVQGQQRAFRVDDAVADFHFLVLVHECFADVGVVAVARGGAADERRPIGDAFCLSRLAEDLRPVDRTGAAAPIALTGAI